MCEASLTQDVFGNQAPSAVTESDWSRSALSQIVAGICPKSDQRVRPKEGRGSHASGDRLKVGFLLHYLGERGSDVRMSSLK